MKTNTAPLAKKVLVIDDDPAVTRSMDRVLTGKGYAVITASNGAEALEKLAAERYDLVFTDIRMPGISGIEVTERLKASQPWLPVVIVTGFGSEEHEARATAAGVSAFLHKPLSPEMIEGSAAEALRASTARAETAAPAAIEVTSAAPAKRTAGGFLKNVALFLASPFIGLAYILAMPFLAMGMLTLIAGKALKANPAARRTGVFAKNTVLFFASPFIGLAYILAIPFVGFAMIARIAGKAIGAKYPKVAFGAKLVAAPFLGLAFLIALPFVGLAMVARISVKAALRRPAAE